MKGQTFLFGHGPLELRLMDGAARGETLAGCGKRVLDPLKSASAERRINNLQSLVSAEIGFFRNLLDHRKCYRQKQDELLPT